MRIKFAKCIAFVVVFVNIVVVYYSLRLFISFRGIERTATPPQSATRSPKSAVRLVTVVIRDFDGQHNDVAATVRSFVTQLPGVQVLVLYDAVPYPPFDATLVNRTNCRMVNLSPQLRTSFLDHQPVFHIKTKYVLFVPDATRLLSKHILHAMLAEMGTTKQWAIVAVPFKAPITCLSVTVKMREWTVKYGFANDEICDGIAGKHVLLMETELLKKLPSPFLQPFPQSLYIQTACLSTKVKILKEVTFQDGKTLLRNHFGTAGKTSEAQKSEHNRRFFNAFQIKQVVRETGRAEWYGCRRDTVRCFGPVLNSMPSYLFEGKWTPPCCLANLRKTAIYVFNKLHESGVRFWLEAGSLLGAMRGGDILPWDHDVDVGFNRDDLGRCPWLRRAQKRPTVDSDGFLWERATEGNFYRVYYSQTNRITVNLLPFFVQNGTMVRDAWFTSHRNMEFPDNFLHPMSSIEFIGRIVPSPNNIRDFLELKFGKGVIEKAEYPDPNRLAFP